VDFTNVPDFECSQVVELLRLAGFVALVAFRFRRRASILWHWL
jgi:hypothetical protein